MNRIRRYNNKYQVLITPHIKISPDSSIILGNWTDINLTDCYVLEFETMQGSQMEAFKYPDIDWYRIIMNHKYIFVRLSETIAEILSDYDIDIVPKLMSPKEFKDKVFNRVSASGYGKYSMSQFNDIISITVLSPFNSILNETATRVMTHMEHLWRDDLRIIDRINKDNEIIIIGKTELGTTYTIRFITTLLNNWKRWHAQIGRKIDDKITDKMYNDMNAQQKTIDNVDLRK